MIELRDTHPRFWALSGLATTWAGAGSEDRSYFVHDPKRGTYREQVERGAFDDATRGTNVVELRREHDTAGPVFASTATRTMRLVDDPHGLALAAALSKRDAATKAAVADVRAGTLTGLSVAMYVGQDAWGTWTDGRTALRRIVSAQLGEVSLVSRPANPQAVISDVRDDGMECRSVPLRALRQGQSEATDDEDETVPCPAWDGAVKRSVGTPTTTGRSAVLLPNDTALLEGELARRMSRQSRTHMPEPGVVCEPRAMLLRPRPHPDAVRYTVAFTAYRGLIG